MHWNWSTWPVFSVAWSLQCCSFPCRYLCWHRKGLFFSTDPAEDQGDKLTWRHLYWRELQLSGVNPTFQCPNDLIEMNPKRCYWNEINLGRNDCNGVRGMEQQHIPWKIQGRQNACHSLGKPIWLFLGRKKWMMAPRAIIACLDPILKFLELYLACKGSFGCRWLPWEL